MVRSQLISTSGKIAKARAHLTIASDRISCNPEEFELMRQELTAVLEKYMELQETPFEIQLNVIYRTLRGVRDVKTIQIK